MQRPVSFAPRIPAVIAALSVVLSLSVLPEPGEAQQLRGSVVDEGSGDAIASAEVRLLDSSGRVVGSVLSDTLGEFRLEAPAPDSFTVHVRRLGYAAVTSPVIGLERGGVVTVEVRLSPDAVALEPVTVIARRPAPARLRDFYDRAERGTQGRIYTRADIEQRRSVAIRHLIQTAPRRLGCPYQIYLDGLPVERIDDLDTLAPPEDIEGIEIYRSAAQIPPELYRPGMCGLVLVWRKPYGEGGRPFTWTRAAIAAGLVVLIFFILR